MRYAPVRHSSASRKRDLLPFDLHVLGLPLAFILSQDQTLHCKVFYFCALILRITLFLPFLFSSSMSNNFVIVLSFLSKAAANLQPFLFPAMLFKSLFLKPFQAYKTLNVLRVAKVKPFCSYQRTFLVFLL